MDELKRKVEQFLQEVSLPAIVHNLNNGQSKFINIYREVFNDTPKCAGCTDEIQKEVNRLIDFTKGIIQSRKNMAIQLKKDALVFDPITNAHYNNRSSGLNEDILWNVLSTTPEMSKFIDGLPEGWQDMAKAHGEKVKAARAKHQKKDNKKVMDEMIAATEAKITEPVIVTVVPDENVPVATKEEKKPKAKAKGE